MSEEAFIRRCSACHIVYALPDEARICDCGGHMENFKIRIGRAWPDRDALNSNRFIDFMENKFIPWFAVSAAGVCILAFIVALCLMEKS